MESKYEKTEVTEVVNKQPTPLQQVRIHEKRAPVGTGPIDSAAASIKTGIQNAAASIETGMPALKAEAAQLGHEIKQGAKDLMNSSSSGTTNTGLGSGATKTVETTTVETTKPRTENEPFHITTEQLPVEIHPENTPVANVGVAGEAIDSLDATILPVSLNQNATDIDSMLATSGGADSRPSALRAVQSGFEKEGETVDTVFKPNFLVDTVNPLLDQAGINLAAKLPAVPVPAVVADTVETVVQQTETVPGIPLEKVAAVVSASAAVLASGMNNFGVAVAERLPGFVHQVEEAVPAIKEAAVDAAETAKVVYQQTADKAVELAATTSEFANEAATVIRDKSREGLQLASDAANATGAAVKDGAALVNQRAKEGATYVSNAVAPVTQSISDMSIKAKDSVTSAVAPVAQTVSDMGVKAKDTIVAVPQMVNDNVIIPAQQTVSSAATKTAETVQPLVNKVTGAKAGTTTTTTTTKETEIVIEDDRAIERTKAHKAVPLYRTEAEVRADEEALGHKIEVAATDLKNKAVDTAVAAKDNIILAKDNAIATGTELKDKAVESAIAAKDTVVATSVDLKNKAADAAVVAKDNVIAAGAKAQDAASQAATSVKETATQGVATVKDVVNANAKTAEVDANAPLVVEKVEKTTITTSRPSAFSSVPTLALKSKSGNEIMEEQERMLKGLSPKVVYDKTKVTAGVAAPGLTGMSTAGQPVSPDLPTPSNIHTAL